MQPGSNSQHNSAKRSGTLADGSQAAGCSHLQRRLIEESDELSCEENHHLLSQELWEGGGRGGAERDSEEEAGIGVGNFFKKNGNADKDEYRSKAKFGRGWIQTQWPRGLIHHVRDTRDE